jgi:pimeloyl-ACP methyl ester carboxylesterase
MRRLAYLPGAALVAVVGLAFLFLSRPVGAQQQVPGGGETGDGGEYETPLGIALETYPYPYPVRFLSLKIDGKQQRMAYMDVAPTRQGGERGAVVLLHGKNFFGAYWHDTIVTLAQAGYRVIVPDQIGFGKSSKPDDIDYSFDRMARHTAQLLDALKVDKTAVVGHSMGGMLAVRFARSYPERTTHLILENPIGLEDYRLKAPPVATEALIEQEMNQTTEQIRAYRRAYFARWLPAYERFVEVFARVRLSGEFPRWARSSALTSQMIYQQTVRHEFSLIQPKTLLIIGQEDRTAIGKDRVSPEVARTMGQYPRLGREAARDIPGSTLVEMKDVGHIPHLEAPDAFHKALLSFLSRP